MATRLEVYKCELCGNIVEVMHGGAGTLVCCGEDMKLMVEGVVDAAREKHIPVIQKTATGYKVIVGEVTHPMLDNHYIEWIELIADGAVLRQYLAPGQAPEAEFCVQAEKVTAREYCNLHGQWKAENS